MTVRSRWILTSVVIVAISAVAAWLPLTARSAEREVVVVARQMAFYVGDRQGANPVIQVAPGERVRLTLVNADVGFDHDFVVSEWDARTPVLHGDGTASIVIQAPRETGRASYVCSLHASMMRGVIEVVADPTIAAR
jgi:plastocyanin